MLCGIKTNKGSCCKNYKKNGYDICHHHYVLDKRKKCCMFTQKGYLCKCYQDSKKNGFCSKHQKFKHLKNKINEKCAICLNSNNNKDKVFLNCSNNHVFHRDCIFKWLKKDNTCPLCREKIKKEFNLMEIIEDFINFAHSENIITDCMEINCINIFKNIHIINQFKISLTLNNEVNLLFLVDLNDR